MMNKSTIGIDVRQALWSRRNILKTGAGLLAGLAGMNVLSVLAAGSPLKVVVVGGGFGGATAAKYLKLWGKDTVEVTLIEPKAKYSSAILSGMVLTNQLEIDRLDFNYDRLTTIHGVNLVQDRVASVDSVIKTVTLEGGTTVNYDRLILSPGIDFVDVPGWDPEKLPHAWDGREQTEILQQQLANFPDNGTLVVRVPPFPYRCPPGPYERSSHVADYLRHNVQGARIVVLDSKPDIGVEPDLFHSLYADLDVEYRSNIEVLSVNSGDADGNGRSITFTESGSVIEIIEADVINLIPDNKAAPLIFSAGLADPATEKWAAIDPLTYESTVAGKEFIHILGDSQATSQPKAAQMASAQAKICADAILRILAGDTPYPEPITTVGCSSPVTLTKINWAGQSWRYDAALGQMVKEFARTAPEPNQENWEPMLNWAHNMFADTFG